MCHTHTCHDGQTWPSAVSRERERKGNKSLALTTEVNLATQSSASSADEIRKSGRAFQSLIVWVKKLPTSAGIAQSVEALYFTTELITSSLRVRVQPGTKYLYPSECMWFGCRLPVAVVSQAYPGNAEICPGFPPPQAALCILLSNEGDAV